MCWTTAGGAPPHQRGLKPGKGQRLQGWKGGQTSLMEEILELQERSGIQDTPESWLSWQGHTYNRVTITFFNTFSNIYLCYIYIYIELYSAAPDSASSSPPDACSRHARFWSPDFWRRQLRLPRPVAVSPAPSSTKPAADASEPGSHVVSVRFLSASMADHGYSLGVWLLSWPPTGRYPPPLTHSVMVCIWVLQYTTGCRK